MPFAPVFLRIEQRPTYGLSALYLNDSFDRSGWLDNCNLCCICEVKNL
ncbi:hypothetical protein PP1Y_Lpl247 (plasmid) [Novosphingobium sp. PP1Y]|nr:hypothetical protein PP1Y_Lpl247 [Novosphingobium sp. PP1Y]